MHKYLSSIGLGSYDENKIRALINQVSRTIAPAYHCINSENADYIELRYDVAGCLGLAIRGSYNYMDEFVPDYYFPFLAATEISTSGTEFSIERLKSEESYCGICDDTRLGVTLVFYIQNALEVIKNGFPAGGTEVRNICLSALSIDGKIILPVEPKAESILSEKSNEKRSALVAAAKSGDEEAMEDLSMEDFDIYSLISRRVEKEDVLSIVETTFIPYGVESDIYNIIGIIENVEKRVNPLTMQEVYIIQVNCNEISFPIAIAKNKLVGVPEVGRRFKGTVWLQGHVCN